LADGPHAQRQALRARGVGEPPQLGLDGRQDAGDLSGRPPEVVGREHPEADGGDADLRAPLQDLVELLGPERVRLAKIRNAAGERVAADAVEGYAEVPRDLPSADLMGEGPLVEVVERASDPWEFHAS